MRRNSIHVKLMSFTLINGLKTIFPHLISDSDGNPANKALTSKWKRCSALLSLYLVRKKEFNDDKKKRNKRKIAKKSEK